MEPVSEAVVNAVAAAAGTSVLELPPLARTVDPDALEVLVESMSADPENSVSFAYAGYDVTVTSSGTVDVRAAAE